MNTLICIIYLENTITNNQLLLLFIINNSITCLYKYIYFYFYLFYLLSDLGTSTWVIVEALLLVETITLNLTC